jgi:hypothetical protein
MRKMILDHQIATQNFMESSQISFDKMNAIMAAMKNKVGKNALHSNDRQKEERAATRIQAIMRTVVPKKLLAIRLKCAQLIQRVSKIYLKGKHLGIEIQSFQELCKKAIPMSGALTRIMSAVTKKPYMYRIKWDEFCKVMIREIILIFDIEKVVSYYEMICSNFMWDPGLQ